MSLSTPSTPITTVLREWIRRLARCAAAGPLLAATAIALPGIAAPRAGAQTPADAAVQTPQATQPAVNPDDLRPAAPQLLVQALQAYSWTENATNIVQLVGGVELQAGDTTLRARNAVIWLRKEPGENRTRVDVVLFGTNEENAMIATPEARRFGPELVADLMVQGSVRFDVPERIAADRRDTPLYQAALELRPRPQTRPADLPTVETLPPPTRPAEGEEGQLVSPVAPVRLRAEEIRTVPGSTGNLAVLATGGVFLFQETQEGNLLEMQAERAVVFTAVERLDELDSATADGLEGAITGVYLEGDVRVVFTPARGRRDEGFAGREQRLEAERAYYDFQTKRATLTQAVLHTSEPTFGQPVTVRADVVRQLAEGQYEALDAELSTSGFATPDYSLNASRVFIRSGPDRDVFGGNNVTARLFGLPFFYFPIVRGSSTGGRLPLRRVGLGNSREFGIEAETEWGLWETLGYTPPESVDATYSLNYYSERGFGAGLAADYSGDLLLMGNRPVNFGGALEGFIIDDHGTDDLGGNRADIPQDDLRGHIDFRHLHFFPEGYSAQLRAGYVSDPTFLPQWERNRFYDGLEHELFFGLERASTNEWLALHTAYSTVDFYTTAERAQENVGIERLPELRYGRFGERVGPFTLTSRNRVGALQYQVYGTDPTLDLGFRDGAGSLDRDESFTGIPTYGYTATPEQLVARGDFRQELSMPLTAGPISIVPFAVGRVTAFSHDVDGEAITRLFGGGGMTISTVLTRIDDTISSDLLDINRLRHVIEPGVTGFASWSDVDRDQLLIYDPEVDAYSDLSAVQVFLRQRWQTQRGGPGRQRSVDVLALNLEANYFGNTPDEIAGQSNIGPITADDFRGLYFNAEPEASLPRDGINADALWRVSDTAAIVGDAGYNFEDDSLATIAAGLVVNRGDRLHYSIGGREVRPLDLTLLVGSASYGFSKRYHLYAGASYDFDEADVRHTNLLISRRFERIMINVGLYIDRIDGDRGIRVGIIPVGFSNLGLDFRR